MAFFHGIKLIFKYSKAVISQNSQIRNFGTRVLGVLYGLRKLVSTETISITETKYYNTARNEGLLHELIT